MKDQLIHMLTRLDTACYRCTPSGPYEHEQPKFRSDLYDVYNKLSEADLETLINIRTK